MIEVGTEGLEVRVSFFKGAEEQMLLLAFEHY